MLNFSNACDECPSGFCNIMPGFVRVVEDDFLVLVLNISFMPYRSVSHIEKNVLLPHFLICDDWFSHRQLAGTNLYIGWTPCSLAGNTTTLKLSDVEHFSQINKSKCDKSYRTTLNCYLFIKTFKLTSGMSQSRAETYLNSVNVF